MSKGTSTQHVPFVEEFKGTKEFQESAAFFKKHGCYTQHPKGSQAYIDFWMDENTKCMLGMTNSYGISVTGIHYFYLNYAHIKSADEVTKRKIFQFPRFLGIDYDYFWLIDICRKTEKDLILVKPRRTGFTLKSSILITHEYNFYRGSVCVSGAYLDKLSNIAMNSILDNLNFLNLHTEWKKARNPDTRDFVKARFQETNGGTSVWKGYMSEIKKLTFKDNPFSGIGLSTNIFLFDEAGVHENLIESFGVTKPCWVDGENHTGIAVVQGTGGDMNSRTRDFHNMWYNPAQYGFLEFDNIWDEKIGGKCGWFISAVRGKLGEYKDLLGRNPHLLGKLMVDEDGNDNEELALEAVLDQRLIAKKGSNPQVIQDAVTQYPLTPQEAFLRSKGTIFSSPEMLEWLGELETTPSLYNQVEKGELVWKDDKLEFRPNNDLHYITSFPLKADEDATGCIAIWERPEFINGEIPSALFIASCDPYDMDKSSVNSLGSFFIYKRFYSHERTYDIIVAEYTGRPKTADEFYENCRRLCIYYNARCLYENQLKGLKNYFLSKNALQYLWEQPDHMIKDIIKDSKVQRSYGVHMTRGTGGSSGIKDMCELYTRDWLYTERADINGEVKFNFHYIKSIALLKELIAYDGETNTDRAIALMLAILQTKELHKIHAQLMTGSSMSYGNDPFLKKIWAKNTTINRFKFN